MLDLEKRVTEFWYRPTQTHKKSERILFNISKPLGHLYEALAHCRRQLKASSSRHALASKPVVIVVGNITVGGTGKTPVILGLVEWLKQKGYRPGVISRGYGAHNLLGSKVVTPNHTVQEVGDEPLLLHRRTQVPVVINKRRRAALDTLCEQFPGVDVVLSDDGMQHYALPRHIEIAVIDGARGFGNGHCLPVGPLREPIERLQHVDALLVHGQAGAVSKTLLEALPESVPQAMFHLNNAGFFRVLDNEPYTLPDMPVSAVTGIGNPKRFFDALAAKGLTLNHCVAFPDHHPFVPSDFDLFGRHAPVIMTEKDSVRCRAFAQPNWCYLRVNTEIEPTLFTHLESVLPVRR